MSKELLYCGNIGNGFAPLMKSKVFYVRCKGNYVYLFTEDEQKKERKETLTKAEVLLAGNNMKRIDRSRLLRFECIDDVKVREQKLLLKPRYAELLKKLDPTELGENGWLDITKEFAQEMLERFRRTEHIQLELPFPPAE